MKTWRLIIGAAVLFAAMLFGVQSVAAFTCVSHRCVYEPATQSYLFTFTLDEVPDFHTPKLIPGVPPYPDRFRFHHGILLEVSRFADEPRGAYPWFRLVVNELYSSPGAVVIGGIVHPEPGFPGICFGEVPYFVKGYEVRFLLPAPVRDLAGNTLLIPGEKIYYAGGLLLWGSGVYPFDGESEGPALVPVENTTWGGIKSLYR